MKSSNLYSGQNPSEAEIQDMVMTVDKVFCLQTINVTVQLNKATLFAVKLKWGINRFKL